MWIATRPPCREQHNEAIPLAAESPFPLLSGAEVVNILHPEAHQPTANNLALHRALGGFEERQ